MATFEGRAARAGPHDELAALNRAVDGVRGLTTADLIVCADVLVDDARARGAAIVRWVGDRLQVLATAGSLPVDVDEVVRSALLAGSPARSMDLMAAPVRCPQAEAVAIVADVGDDDRTAMVVQAAAYQLGMRLEVLDTQRRLRAAHAHTDTLLSATQALVRSLELQDVFAAILRQLQLVVPYDSCSVQRLDGDVLHIIGGHGFPNLDEILGISFDVTAEDNPNREVIETGRTRIMADASAHYPTFRQGPHRPANIRGWMGVPLLFGDRVLGMFSVDSRQPDFYDREHARIAEAFAAQAAIAVENARLFGEMRRLATHDALTGLPNRRHLDDVGTELLDRARAEARPVAMLMSDIDRFKVVNDTHGHAVGDEVLREIADRFHGCVRPDDVVTRFGGEEFVILLPETDRAVAEAVGERLRQAVADRPIATAVGDLELTISVGVAWRDPCDAGLPDLLKEADRALYAAKEQGRNRVVTA